MSKGSLMMDTKNIKNEYKKMRPPKMDISISDTSTLAEFFQKIKAQDREDEKYLLHNQIIPLTVGLIIMIILILINPIKSVLMLTGIFLISCALLISLILRIIDYKNISKESYNLSLSSFLKQKEQRLKTWRSTPSFYKLIFSIFVLGLIFMVLGNTAMIKDFGLNYLLLFIIIYLLLFISAWTIGEYFFRKRHKQKHRPLIKSINEIVQEIKEDEEN
jgi:cell division protein FtsW (lipid II flippase)